ncbi:MAG TPA: hypothetical protein VFU46_09400 [Gemmatimonadales bacterium]|nr:hypothetical protein [Gemmatimonadales bacterium]
MTAPARVAAAALLAAVLQGCSLTLDTRSLGVPVTMAAPAEQPAEGDRFEVTSRALYGFWGAFKIRQPSLQKTLAGQLVGGKGVADLRIRVRSSFGDVLITALTGGLIVPRAVTFEGVITK